MPSTSRVSVVRVSLLCGSFTPDSVNANALVLAEQFLRSDDVEIGRLTHLDDIPAFRPDQNETPPPNVAQLRASLHQSDAAVIAAPEYAGGVAGAMKNILDWMVTDGALYRKPVVIISAGTSGGVFAREQLVRTLAWQGALVVGNLGIVGRDVDAAADDLSAAMTVLQLAVRSSLSDRLVMIAPILEPYGIDLERFA